MSTKWTIESWCDNQIPSNWNVLAESSQIFLHKLNLSSIHPFCDESSNYYFHPYEIPGIPSQGPLLEYDHLDGLIETIITFAVMAIPSLLAMMELWLRLFASIISPLGITYLLYETILQKPNTERTRTMKLKVQTDNSTTTSSSSKTDVWLSTICTLTTASSVVILTDTLYVLEFGPQLGGILLLASVYLSIRTCYLYRLQKTLLVQIMLIFVCCFLTIDLSLGKLHFGCPKETITNIEEGLYYDHSNLQLSNVVQNYWDEKYRTYTYNNTSRSSSSSKTIDDTVIAPTRWMITGDTRTGLPFLLNKLPMPTYTRVWVPMPHDGEVVAIDISFPLSGHDPSKPMYMILHGLNGGSAEGFVRDMVIRANAEGSTVAIMIARGLMDLPIRGFNCFHGARWEDAHVTAQTIKAALEKGQILTGVGYSMGAIIIGNMIARTGTECALDAGVAISGGLDMRQQIDFNRAQRLWQPMLTTTLRDTFVLGKWGERVRYRLTKEEMHKLMLATHITELDETAVVAYNDGFRNVVHYYSEMSVLGDIPYQPDSYVGSVIPRTKRVHNISIPFCVVHALDDPLISWRTVAANDGIMSPSTLTKTGSGQLLLLLTKRGGHVGWPLGLIPQKYKWKWMSEVAISFTDAIVSSDEYTKI